MSPAPGFFISAEGRVKAMSCHQKRAPEKRENGRLIRRAARAGFNSRTVKLDEFRLEMWNKYLRQTN